MNVSFLVIFFLIALGFVATVDCPYCKGTGLVEIVEGQNPDALKVAQVEATWRPIRRGSLRKHSVC